MTYSSDTIAVVILIDISNLRRFICLISGGVKKLGSLW